MPGFDQTGPMGEGPMTGGGRGVCTGGNKNQGNTGFGVGRGGRPRGGGRGRCFGGGRGMRRGGGGGFGRQAAPVNRDEGELRAEIKSLSDEVAALRAELAAAKGDPERPADA